MVALGGSMVKGMGCSCETLSQEECSYGSRLAAWLGSRTRRRVNFFNRAAGGSPTRGLLALLSESIRVPTMVESERVAASGRQVMAAADVLVIDFSINDVGLKANTSPWYHRGQAWAWVTTLRTSLWVRRQRRCYVSFSRRQAQAHY